MVFLSNRSKNVLFSRVEKNRGDKYPCRRIYAGMSRTISFRGRVTAAGGHCGTAEEFERLIFGFISSNYLFQGEMTLKLITNRVSRVCLRPCQCHSVL